MSIALATGDTITGVAGSATAITYTISGDEIAAGADAFKVLAQGQLPSSVGTLYTVPASTAAIVKTIHLANMTAGTVTARLNVKGTAAAHAILPPISILAGGFAVYADDGWRVYNDQGQLLSVGATGATGADGMSSAATPAIVHGTAAAIGAAATAIRSDATIVTFDVTAPTDVAAVAAVGSVALAAHRDHAHGGLGLPLALTGAIAATRYVGGTASVAPTTGTFAVGDFVITAIGHVYICTTAGAPGIWTDISGGVADILDLPTTETVTTKVLAPNGTGGVEFRTEAGGGQVGTINVVIDGGGSAIATGIKGDVLVDFACVVNAWTLLADQSGSIVIDIWKDTLGNFPPTDADSMCSGKEPTITTATNATDTSITDWTTDDIADGDILRFNVDSCTTITRVTLALKVTRV
jgi:hypothetical protein